MIAGGGSIVVFNTELDGIRNGADLCPVDETNACPTDSDSWHTSH
jgi:hypothetical protein